MTRAGAVASLVATIAGVFAAGCEERALVLPPIRERPPAEAAGRLAAWQPIDPAFRGCEGG